MTAIFIEKDMAVNIPIYAGSASFFPGESTPFGFYDNDPQFQQDAERLADWCARRLGYPIVDVELQDINIFAAFEEAVTEYGNQVNTYSARDNILTVMGFDTGSTNFNGRYIEPTLTGLFKLARQYGSEVGAGGNLTWYTGSVSVQNGKQVYNLLTDSSIETGSFTNDQFTIRRIFHESTPSILSYYDPSSTGGVASGMLNEFGWSGMSTGYTYMVMPLYQDILRIQAVEFNDQIRRSGYSFQLTKNRLRIFPIPTEDFTMWFNYTLDDESIGLDDSVGKISDHSNIPYGRLVYKYINEIGRQWIRKYTLALCKEMLGYIRGKYQDIVVPDNTTTMNYSDLITAATDEKTSLIEELKEILDQFSRQAQLERKQAESEVLSQQLAKVPLRIYIG